MAIDYQNTAALLVEALGGETNIASISHCATRLRFVLRDASIPQKDRISAIPGVITAVTAGGQFQVVIGNHVRDVYTHVTALLHDRTDTGNPIASSGKKPGIFSRIIDVISSIFAPFLYTLAACGILQGILGIFVALGAIDTEGGTYQILNFISWTAFTFLPVLIAVTASKKFGLNTFVGVVIACALICPDYLAMVDSEEAVYFLGLQVQLLSYTSSVIPIILAIWIASYLERFWNRVLPLVVRSLFSAMFTITMMVPLTLLAFGPIGNSIGSAIGGIYNFFYDFSPIVAGIMVGGLWEVLVIFGVHWGITPVTVGNYATLGYDTFTGLQASAVFSQAGASLGVCLKTQNREMKKIASSAAITGLFGITEPAIYGVNLRFKRPMICGCIAGAVGGAIAGAFRAVSWSYNMPGIATLPAYFKQGYATEFIGLIISVIVSFVFGTILTYFVGFRDEPNVEPVATATETVPKNNAKPILSVSSPVSGNVIPLTEVGDDVFSSGVLGQGVGIIPENDTLVSPVDGRIEMLANTAHAIGIRTATEISLLLHIGIDTVKLNGNGFNALVKEGDFIRRGTPLVQFSPSQIEKSGYDPTILFLVTTPTDGYTLICETNTHVELGDTLFKLERLVEENG